MAQGGDEIASLANLVRPESFKKVLRYYHNQANGEPNAFVIGVAKTLIQVAQYPTGATSKEVGELRRIAGNLPAVPFDLTEKNKALLRQLSSTAFAPNSIFSPSGSWGKLQRISSMGRVRFVEAQVAIAIDILLASPLRPQNLSSLSLASALQRTKWSATPAAHSHCRPGHKNEKARNC